jgi:hypothetical protein
VNRKWRRRGTRRSERTGYGSGKALHRKSGDAGFESRSGNSSIRVPHGDRQRNCVSRDVCRCSTQPCAPPVASTVASTKGGRRGLPGVQASMCGAVEPPLTRSTKPLLIGRYYTQIALCRDVSGSELIGCPDAGQTGYSSGQSSSYISILSILILSCYKCRSQKRPISMRFPTKL